MPVSPLDNAHPLARFLVQVGGLSSCPSLITQVLTDLPSILDGVSESDHLYHLVLSILNAGHPNLVDAMLALWPQHAPRFHAIQKAHPLYAPHRARTVTNVPGVWRGQQPHTNAARLWMLASFAPNTSAWSAHAMEFTLTHTSSQSEQGMIASLFALATEERDHCSPPEAARILRALMQARFGRHPYAFVQDLLRMLLPSFPNQGRALLLDAYRDRCSTNAVLFLRMHANPSLLADALRTHGIPKRPHAMSNHAILPILATLPSARLLVHLSCDHLLWEKHLTQQVDNVLKGATTLSPALRMAQQNLDAMETTL